MAETMVCLNYFLNSDLMSVLKLTSAEHFPGEFSKISFFCLLQAIRPTKVSLPDQTKISQALSGQWG